MLYGCCIYDIIVKRSKRHMKLNYDRKSKNPTYFVQYGYRIGKKTTTKNVYTIGKHSELLKEHADPLAYANEVVAEFNSKLKENDKQFFTLMVDLSEKLINNGNDVSKSTLKNIGYFYLKAVYDQLDLNKYFNELTKDRKIKYDMNEINMALTAMRIIRPGSKLDNINHLHELYGEFDFEYYDVMRAIEELGDNFDSYIAHLFESSNKIVKRNTSVCYFDCTNFYFEKEEENEDIVDEVTGEVIRGLLKYGVSKEHRPNPIIQMGLFMDADGIPLSMCINPGNANESLCAVPAEEKLIDITKKSNLIYCSDSGLGYSSIRRFNSAPGRGFIVTQSIKKLKETLKEAVFNDYDYKLLSSNEPVSIEYLKTFDKSDENNINLYNDFAYKSIETEKLVDLGIDELKELKNGQVKKTKAKGTLKHRIIVTYSRKMDEYQKKIRKRQIERAKYLLENTSDPESIKRNPNDYRRFIKNDKSSESKYSIDEEKINEESKYDGYYAIATNIFNMSEKEIFEINSRRYKIEDCFRIMKTDMSARPAYVQKDKRLMGHFLTCYTALLILRLIEVKINRRKKHHFSIHQLIETIKNMNVADITPFYRSQYTGSNCLDVLEAEFNLGLDNAWYLPNSLNRLLKSIKIKKTPYNNI